MDQIRFDPVLGKRTETLISGLTELQGTWVKLWHGLHTLWDCIFSCWTFLFFYLKAKVTFLWETKDEEMNIMSERVRQCAACASGILNNPRTLHHHLWMMDSAKHGYMTGQTLYFLKAMEDIKRALTLNTDIILIHMFFYIYLILKWINIFLLCKPLMI